MLYLEEFLLVVELLGPLYLVVGLGEVASAIGEYLKSIVARRNKEAQMKGSQPQPNHLQGHSTMKTCRKVYCLFNLVIKPILYPKSQWPDLRTA